MGRADSETTQGFDAGGLPPPPSSHAPFSTHLLREAIKDSPEYNGAVPPKRSYATQLYHFYGKRGYWL